LKAEEYPSDILRAPGRHIGTPSIWQRHSYCVLTIDGKARPDRAALPGSMAVQATLRASPSAAKLAKRRLKCGVFHSLVALQAAINRFIEEANADPRPFRWTKDPDSIIAAVRCGHQDLSLRGGAK
jgi:hypothetical protein